MIRIIEIINFDRLAKVCFKFSIINKIKKNRFQLYNMEPENNCVFYKAEVTNTDGIPCSRIEKCASKVLWRKVKESIEDVLNSITLQDILNDYNTVNNYKGVEIPRQE